MIFTGHKKQWEFLKKKFESDQLSHAYLFSGARGIGKEAFAMEFVKLVNCLGESKPCGKCVNCQAIERNNFPDLLVIKSVNSISSIKNKKDSLEIDVSQIRDAQNFLSYKSYYGSFKSVIVEDAERMNTEAQSCFLKTLEEPKGKTLLILVSSKPDMLLSTITSRCQTVKFFRPKDLPLNSEKMERSQAILKDLMSVINSDLSDKFKYTKALDFEEQSLGEILEVLQRYFRDLLLEETGVGKKSGGEVLLKKYSLEKLKNILNLIEDINNKFLFTNINQKIALEILLMEL